MSWDKPEAHEPKLKRNDGTTIMGLKKCCVKCGLSETYWGRWPDCESVRNVEAELGPEDLKL